MPAQDDRRLKSGIDKDDARHSRTVVTTELRKAKRESGLQKRRNMQTATTVDEQPDNAEDDLLQLHIDATLDFVRRNGPAEAYEAALASLTALRKLLSKSRHPPIDHCIEAGVVPALVTMLSHYEVQMQFEAAWCLTNIASGTPQQCATVLHANGVPPLTHLLGSSNMDVREQAAWALGNIAGDGPQPRDAVLANGGLVKMLDMIDAAASAGAMAPLRNAVWALSNLMRGKPAPADAAATAALPTLAKLTLIADEEVLVDTCWALSYVTDAGDDRIDAAVGAGIVPLLMGLMSPQRTEKRARTPALRTLANILTGSAAATQAALDAGILAVLPEALASPRTQTRKEACWALSNIAAGTLEQSGLLLHSPLLGAVVRCLETDEYEVKKEAAWVLANLLHGYTANPSPANAARAAALVHLGSLRGMVSMLSINDAAMQKLMLEALGVLLDAGEALRRASHTEEHPFLAAFDEAHGIDALEALQLHDNEDIYQAAVSIMDKYFAEDENDENVLPASAGDTFAFGAPPAHPALVAYAF